MPATGEDSAPHLDVFRRWLACLARYAGRTGQMANSWKAPASEPGPPKWALAALRSLHVTDGAIGMVTAEDCTHGKPDPEPFRRGAELLGLDPRGLVALEDAPAGIASARAAGVGHAVGVTTGHPAHVLVGAGAGETATDLVALADTIEARRPGEQST